MHAYRLPKTCTLTQQTGNKFSLEIINTIVYNIPLG